MDVYGYMVKDRHRLIYKLMRATPDDDFSFLDDIQEGMLYWNFMNSEPNLGAFDGLHIKYERAFIIKYDEEKIIHEAASLDG